MGNIVEPKVFLLGETRANERGLREYLEYLGVSDWTSDAPTDAELLTEVYSRGCYMSYGTTLNKNLKQVREGNKAHLENILKVKHGSVTEHVSFNFMFCDVSRTFTHELVRHRVGCAISQQSLRYVRLDNLNIVLPNDLETISTNVGSISMETVQQGKALMLETVEFIEDKIRTLNELFQIDTQNMEIKKRLTSFIRRIAPIGIGTQIGWTVNARTLRHVLEQRTHPSAEAEIRFVFQEVGNLVTGRYPNLFGDYEIEEVNGLKWFKTENGKI